MKIILKVSCSNRNISFTSKINPTRKSRKLKYLLPKVHVGSYRKKSSLCINNNNQVVQMHHFYDFRSE